LEDGFTLHLVARRAAEGQNSSGTSEGNTHANVNFAANGGLLDDISRLPVDFEKSKSENRESRILGVI
jgi:hypothetical protein